jgi:hypothetical protein
MNDNKSLIIISELEKENIKLNEQIENYIEIIKSFEEKINKLQNENSNISNKMSNE